MLVPRWLQILIGLTCLMAIAFMGTWFWQAFRTDQIAKANEVAAIEQQKNDALRSVCLEDAERLYSATAFTTEFRQGIQEKVDACALAGLITPTDISAAQR